MDFLPVFEVLRRRFWYILGLAVAGFAIALIYSKVATRFESSVSMYPSNSNSVRSSWRISPSGMRYTPSGSCSC
ncbi:MAG: hypothetical protein U0176_10065 [Bacteroidia bacterium]